jgi:hypothetical protein
MYRLFVAVILWSNIIVNEVSSFATRGFTYRPLSQRIQIVSQKNFHAHMVLLSDSSSENLIQGDIESKTYDYLIKKAKRKHIKEISRLCVDTFLGDGDDWLHISQEKQRLARDLGDRLG